MGLIGTALGMSSLKIHLSIEAAIMGLVLALHAQAGTST